MPGGVCQVLDYEVEQMADYVSEMATRIVMPQASVNATFRKFVAQILTSTRLPSTTILLGMNYLAKRINMMTAAGQTNHTEGQIWRLLTVALLLGSKFLDDNTFQNKSWSEVSGIAVQELNTLEYEWLGAINWCLYTNLDKSKDYNAWLKNWREWCDNKRRQIAQDRATSMLSPTRTEVARPRNQHTYSTWHQQQIAEYERLSSMKRNQHQQLPAYRRDQGQCTWSLPAPWFTPLTPPDSGYGTPEYANSATSVNSQYNEWFDRAITHDANGPRHFQQPTSYNHGHHSGPATRNHSNYPAYYNYGHNIWEPPTVADCNCTHCGATGAHHKPPPYSMVHGYDQAPVGCGIRVGG